VNRVKQCRIFPIVEYYEFVIINHFPLFRKEGLKQMALHQIDTKTSKTKVEDNSTLKGTLASVFLLGFFLVSVWVSVYFLFLDRF